MKFLLIAATSGLAGYLLAENRRLRLEAETVAALATLRTKLERGLDVSEELSQLDAIADRDDAAIQGVGVKITEEGAQVRAEVQRLQDMINRGVPRDQLLARVQRFEATAQRLEGLGQDISNIFTPEAPPEEPPTELPEEPPAG